MAGYRLVIMLVGSRGWEGLWSLRPPRAIYRLYLEAHFTYNWGSGILSRWIGAVGVNPRFSLREETRLEVLSPQHQNGSVCNVELKRLLEVGGKVRDHVISISSKLRCGVEQHMPYRPWTPHKAGKQSVDRHF
jgi:hypothetical protein